MKYKFIPGDFACVNYEGSAIDRRVVKVYRMGGIYGAIGDLRTYFVYILGEPETYVFLEEHLLPINLSPLEKVIYNIEEI